MRLGDLLAGLTRGPLPAAAATMEVGGIARDSRAVAPGNVFVAVPGVRVDGAAFAAQAVARGAVAVVSERALPGLPVPVLRVSDAAEALGLLADRLLGEPSREVRPIGVTGTNGKTTTAFLTAALLEATGRPTSLLGTVANRVAGVETASSMTTPDALEVHGALARTRDAGARDLVMEVSSHALDQRRVAGVRFGVGVFTNLTRDHLDYHGSLAAYGDAKARLFEALAPEATAVLNAADPFAAALAARTRARVVRYACLAGDPRATAEVWARLRATDLGGSRLELSLWGERFAVRFPLVGAFNVENGLAAAAAAVAAGAPRAEVAAALARVPPVPGRLERVAATEPGAPTVLVDFAHTPDALARVGATLRPLVRAGGGRLTVVFGCGGDRDRGKRAPMARAVERYADRAVVTSDNPRGEDPAAIVAEVLAGFADRRRAVGVVDRAAAIEQAIAEAGPRDLVLLAGKGHEQTQRFADRAVPFDDREVARVALRRRRRRSA